jgi:hypothetical protein
MAVIKVELLETNIVNLENKSKVLQFNDEFIAVQSPKIHKVIHISMSCVSAITTIDSDKYYSIAKINFGDDLYFTFKCQTNKYLKHIKHRKLSATEPFEMVEHTSAIAGVTVTLLVLFIFSQFFSNDENKSTKETSDRTQVSTEVRNAAKELIRQSGYKCDSISFILQSSWDDSYRVTCNDDYYVYSIDNKGGNWVVSLD